MGLNAIQQFVAHSVLGGLPSPLLQDLEAVVQPPVFSDIASQPYAFVWAGEGSVVRQTAPRQQRPAIGMPVAQGGYQKFTWQVEIALACVLSPDDPNLEQAFPCLFDAVVKALATTTMPTVITDPITEQEMQLLTIGETQRSDYASVVTTGAAGQSLVRFGATVTCEVQEKVDYTGGVVVP